MAWIVEREIEDSSFGTAPLALAWMSRGPTQRSLHLTPNVAELRGDRHFVPAPGREVAVLESSSPHQPLDERGDGCAG